MRAQVIKRREALTSGLWFVPTLIVAACALLAVATLTLDRSLAVHGREAAGWLDVSANSARSLLTVIAGSMIGVMGTVLSMTVIALMLASTQFNPRALHSFTRDRGTQVVIGAFTGAFTFSVIVLRAVRDADEGLFVPGVSIVGAIVLGLCGVAAVIYFTHHVATSIQVSNVIATLARAARPLLDRRFPDGRAGAAGSLAEGVPGLPGAPPGLRFVDVPARDFGYVQVIDVAGLVRLAAAHDLIVRVERPVGAFVADDEPVASVAAARDGTREIAPHSLDEALASRIREHIALGEYRTIRQDPEFAMRQIADITVKALSAGVNDPTTAITCLDHLFALFRHLAPRDDPAPHYADDAGRLRVIAAGADFESLLDSTIGHIVRKLGADTAVIVRLVDGVNDVASLTSDERRRRLLWTLESRIAEVARREIRSPADLALVEEHVGAVGKRAGVGERFRQ